MNSLSLNQQIRPSSSSNSKMSNNDGCGLAIKPFSCPKCERKFNSKYNVIRHLKQYHADRRQFKCSICGRDYKWIDSLHKHMKIHKNSSNNNQNTSINNINLDISKTKTDESTNIEEIDENDQSNNNSNNNSSEIFQEIEEENNSCNNDDSLILISN